MNNPFSATQISSRAPPTSLSTYLRYRGRAMSDGIVPTLPLLDSAFDLATITFATALLLLSLLSLFFILHLRLKSRAARHLHNFSTLSAVRLLLVSLVAFWTLSDLLRLPFFRRGYLYPFFPHPTLHHQASLCKLHLVLSLGLFQPGFLLTILFLLNVSVKNRTPGSACSVVGVLATCLPVLCLQILFVYFSNIVPAEAAPFSNRVRWSSVISRDESGYEVALCVYPLLSRLVFGALAIAYLLCLWLSCWRVVSVVINKGLRVRIYTLTLAVTVSLSVEVLSLGLSGLWKPDETSHGAAALLIFLSALSCAVAGEGIMVIKPIADTLAADEECCEYRLCKEGSGEMERGGACG
ncbi:uncharacterized protein LOC131145615 [Malania oleifera]|uniref:uncharacterized protein LOC131145615 n=1 Tax=Malania oleifera TaxID=397392 RepID=UPI0025ADA04B|nr:uncharacterized protein LOC131145615 [Malania oleifera]XP_057950774.1 uncharacterized protein LOC131145615 [Malania oleifera]